MEGHFLEPKEIEKQNTSKVDFEDIETRLFINNQFVKSEEGKTFPTINPATEGVICHVQEAGCEDVDKAVSLLM